MAEKQVIGDQQSLKDGPRSMERMPFGGGKVDVLGEQVALKSSPTPDQFNHKGISGGEKQVIGTGVDLNATPRRGYESGTSMSERTEYMNSVGQPATPSGKKE